jgi:hypothetical protein
MNEKAAADYICQKIFIRSFIEENGTGLYFAMVEPRRITITKKPGKLADKFPKLIIDL